jgi:hypothetical protein
VSFVVRKTFSEEECTILTTLILKVEKTNSWCARKGDLQRAFPLNVLMILASAITVVADGECLTCSGFSLGKTVHLRNFEFIVDYFGGLSFSLRRGVEGATFMSSTRSRASTPRWAMTKESIEEFLTVSGREGSFDLPSTRRRSAGAPLALAVTTPWMENAPTTQAATMVPSRMVAPWLETNLLIERCHTHHRGQQVQACARHPTVEQEAVPWRSTLIGKQAVIVVHHGTSLHLRWRGS